MAPLVSKLVDDGVIEARAVHQTATFEAGVRFARTEGIVPAPESNHAVRVAIDEALAAKEEGRQRTILFNLSGHGHFDLAAYEKYLAGSLEDIRARHWRMTVRASGTPSGPRVLPDRLGVEGVLHVRPDGGEATLTCDGEREAIEAELRRAGYDCLACSPASLDEIFFARAGSDRAA